MQWQMFVTPALIGLPLNIYATASYAVGSYGGKTAVHKKTPTMLKLAAVMAVLWTFMSVIPSAALYTDVVCVFPVDIAKGTSYLCDFLRCTVHILVHLTLTPNPNPNPSPNPNPNPNPNP